jgi:hypothetical protein
MEITLRDIYDAQQRTEGRLETMTAQLATHAATTAARLDAGQAQREDHETRLRVLEGRLPADLTGQVSSLQQFRWFIMGGAMSVGALSGVVAALLTAHH